MDSHKRGEAWVHAVLLLVTISWGFNNVSMKIGFEYITPLQFNGLRLAFSLPFMLFFAFFMPGRTAFTRSDVVKLSLLGLFGLGLFQVLFPIGIDETSTPVGGILMATMPIHVAVLNLVFKLEKPSWRTIAGILLTVAGLAFIGFSSTGQADATQTTLRGVVCVVMAEFGYAVNTTFIKSFLKRYSVLQVTGLTMSAGTIAFFAVNMPQMLKLDLLGMAEQAWVTTLYSGLVGYMLANIAWNRAVGLIGGTRVSIYGNVPPVFVLLLGAVVFGELLQPLQIAGTVVILAGVVLVQAKVRPGKLSGHDEV